MAAVIMATLCWSVAAAAPQYAELRDLVQRQGAVRVIVQAEMSPGTGSRELRVADALERLRAETAQFNIAPLKELSRRPLAVYLVNAVQLDRLIDSGLVERIYADRLNRPSLDDSVPYIGGTAAHAFGLTGKGAAVAVIDTGVEASHSTFGGRVVEEACYSSNVGGQYQASSLCPGGAESAIGTGSAAPCSGIPGCFHGTHVASIAAGADLTYEGVAPEAQVIAVKVFSRFDSNYYCGLNPPCILAFDSDIIAGLDFVESLAGAYQVGAANMSLGGGQFTSACDGSSAFAAPVADLRTAGIAVAVSSGNSGYTNAVGSPACVTGTVSVGSIFDGDGSISSYSNSSSLLDMLAPGQSITAAVPGNSFGTASGTSMAAPHVAGALTLLKALDGSLTASYMETMLATYAVPVLDSRNGLTFPRLDLGLVTGQLPAVMITAPADGSEIAADTNPVVLAGTATDTQDGDLSTQISWTSSIDGTLVSPATLSVGTHSLSAAVVDTDGNPGLATAIIEVFNAPAVTITAPANGASALFGNEVTFAATATDDEDGTLSSSVQWLSQLDGSIGSGASINAALSIGTHTITATVMDSDGHAPSSPPTIEFTVLDPDADGDGMLDAWEAQYGVDDPAGDPDGDTLTNLQEHDLGTNPVDAAPTVQILAPTNNAVFDFTAAIDLAGLAADAEDGDVSGSIEWTSSLAGLLGTGASLQTTLAIGTHTITATVTDSQGGVPVSVPAVDIDVIIQNPGDVDGDGSIDVEDTLLLEQHLNGQITLTPDELTRADVYPAGLPDGAITLADWLLLQKILMAP